MRTKLSTYDGGSGGSLYDSNGNSYSNQFGNNTKDIMSQYQEGLTKSSRRNTSSVDDTDGSSTDSLSSLYGSYGNNNNSNNSASSDTDGNDANAYDDALAELARQGNYEAYWNKTVQLGNIQRLAQKNMQNTLKQQGINTQGAGTIAGTQLSNAYMNAQASALKDYNDTESQITEDAYNRAETAKQNQLSEYQNLLSTASQNGNVSETLQKIFESNPDMDDETRQKLNALAVAYDNTNSENASRVSTFQQYMQLASQSGNLEKWYTDNVLNNSDLTDKEKTELQRYYDAMGESDSGSSFIKSVGLDPTLSMYTSADELKQTAYDPSGNTADDVIGHEIEGMTNYVSTNKLAKPTLFHLHSDRLGSNMYVYYDPSKGGYYVLTLEQAKQFSGDSYYVHGRKNSEISKGARIL